MISERFDKYNKQSDYTYIAEDSEGNSHVGYVFIDKPWYSHESAWTYYIRKNDYSKVGNIGNDDGKRFIDIIVNKDSIRPNNQINRIENWIRNGNTVLLIESQDVETEIKAIDDIPYEKWNR